MTSESVIDLVAAAWLLWSYRDARDRKHELLDGLYRAAASARGWRPVGARASWNKGVEASMLFVEQALWCAVGAFRREARHGRTAAAGSSCTAGSPRNTSMLVAMECERS